MSIQPTSVCVNLLTCIYLEQGGVNEQHKGKKKVSTIKPTGVYLMFRKNAPETFPLGICFCPFTLVASAVSHVTSSEGGSSVWLCYNCKINLISLKVYFY